MICHEYRCVFVHIPKCGGQSIEHLFLNALGLTWKNRSELLLLENKEPELGPPRLAHLRAMDYVNYQYLTPEKYKNYYKFSIVRNPWDRMVSFYKYLSFFPHLGYFRSIGFKTFVMSEFPKIIKQHYWFVRPQHEFIFDDNGDSVIDFIGNLETLQTSVNHVCEHIGLPETVVPHSNYSKRHWVAPRLRPKNLFDYSYVKLKNAIAPSFHNYTDYYDAETRQYVAELYRRDIDYFDYQFDRTVTRTT